MYGFAAKQRGERRQATALDKVPFVGTIKTMNSRNRRTLAAIFSRPTLADIRWDDILALFRALEATVDEGRGSRVRVILNGVAATFHRPHPGPVAKKGAVESVRELLTNAGVRP
ncbi:MAG: type II toxin-antitoxin system HicA family toxin [Solidesulfovibrio sp. DCME]|uniref:type II toxin-antitoxin system HicA family toxin n=1 Tax=Solidesulfovibrio sp. DCME TaxID=3447380 RepID=UPI003D1194AF